jgi:hypothetical protein
MFSSISREFYYTQVDGGEFFSIPMHNGIEKPAEITYTEISKPSELG